ncbi:hypothetical protein DQ783_13725 [Salmonella enterica subsp. enterica serovar Newport]|nr:hypothetical protein [Salmonella enterica subsp. enterica serovar Newport]EBX1209985.1 hypothetical protein [Salmonella enterica subsp. enterica serovar Newport]
MITVRYNVMDASGVKCDVALICKELSPRVRARFVSISNRFKNEHNRGVRKKWCTQECTQFYFIYINFFINQMKMSLFAIHIKKSK